MSQWEANRRQNLPTMGLIPYRYHNYADMMYWGPHCRNDSEVWWKHKLVLGPQWKRKCFKGNFHYVSEHQQLLGPRSIAGTEAGTSSCRYSGKLASVGYTIGGWWLTQQFVVCYNQPAPLNPFLSLSRQTIYFSKNTFYGQHYVKTTFCVNENTYDKLINSAGRGNSDRPD